MFKKCNKDLDEQKNYILIKKKLRKNKFDSIV